MSGVFAEDQPRAGDTILHCGHLARIKVTAAHWFKYESPVQFARPDDTRGEAEWLVVCELCFVKYGSAVRVRGDGTWTGDEPTIEKMEN